LESVRLQKVARTIVEKFACVKEGEDALVLSDTSVEPSIIQALWGAADAVGARAQMLVMSSATRPWQPPPKIVQQACFASDVLIRVTGLYDWGYIPFAEEVHKYTREAIVYKPTVDTLLRLYDFDVEKMIKEVATVSKLYEEHKNVHITSQTGTDITFRIVDTIMDDDGVVKDKGEWSFLPGGNPSVCAVPGTGEGKLVFDGTFGDSGIMTPVVLKSNMELTVRKGMITEIRGGEEAKRFESWARALGDQNIFNCPAEFGPGLLDTAWMSELLLIAERVRGAIHVGIGSNLSIPGGTVAAKHHLDGLISKPTLTLDNITVVENGELEI